MPTSYSNPGAIADVVSTSGKIESTWGNAIRDRVINSFATTGARDTAIPTPVAGQFCVIGTTETFLQYCGATDGWRAPWNLPWGLVTKSVASAAQTGISTVTDVTSGSVTFTAVANRNYFIRGYAPVTKHTAGGDVLLIISDGSGSEIERGRITCSTDAGLYQVFAEIYETYSAGSVTRKLRLQATTGTVDQNYTNSTANAYISVMDVGPSGNPS